MQVQTKFLFIFSVDFSLFLVSNPYVGPSPRIRIYFFFLSTLTEKLISNPKIIHFLPNPLPIENSLFLSNLIPYPEYLYLSISFF